MPHTPTPTEILTNVAGSLVAKEQYASMEEALRSLAISAVHSKTVHYRRRIRRLQNKYNMDFDDFSAHLLGRATPVEEDDWFAWRSARRMLTEWQQTYQDLRDEQAG